MLMGHLHTSVRRRDSGRNPQFHYGAPLPKEIRRFETGMGRFTLTYLAAPGDVPRGPSELTYYRGTEDYGSGRNRGRLLFAPASEPKSIELLRKRAAFAPGEPWLSASNMGL
jgi:lactoylglutathione lyase